MTVMIFIWMDSTLSLFWCCYGFENRWSKINYFSNFFIFHLYRKKIYNSQYNSHVIQFIPLNELQDDFDFQNNAYSIEWDLQKT